PTSPGQSYPVSLNFVILSRNMIDTNREQIILASMYLTGLVTSLIAEQYAVTTPRTCNLCFLYRLFTIHPVKFV
ncbi:MAG: hypothetical protein NTV30_02110, partial [Chloroflexi bacterium]|nr:hypothetical protein [Chloroflexota bacterium]